ncbi:MAG: condensation domain-containing protein [Beijerinckiaceae bacterium]|nr:condensation domain-containing protein [Beijerinckiaceae bacterium]
MESVCELQIPETQNGEELLFPCSSSQQRCWFIHSISPGSSVLNIALRWEIKGRFDVSTIEKAFQAIIDRHEILRTRFVEKDGEPMQEVASSGSFRLQFVDLTKTPEERQLAEAVALGRQEAHLPFDLGKLPLIRVTLLRLSPVHGILLLTVHEIIFDGWCIRLLAHEFGTIVEAIEANRVPSLPDLPLQYGDYSAWQKEYFASGGIDKEAAYWKAKLAGAPYFEISPDYERPAEPSYQGEIIAALLPPALGAKLEAEARKRNVTPFAFGCAVIGAMLHRYTGENDIVFGTQIAGRDEIELENLIGVFLNNLVMRFDASGDPAFTEFLARVNERVQEALIHQRMPFHKLVEIVNPPRDPSRTPLISINFTVLRDLMDHKFYGDLYLNALPSLSSGALYDFNFFMVHWPSGWRIAMEYKPDMFERATAEALHGFVIAAFELAITNPDAALSSLVPPVRDTLVQRRSSGSLTGIQQPRPPAVSISAAQPRDDEEKMMAIWREILEVPSVGPASNFFELGGHSLMAMRLMTRVASTFGTKITVMTLFQAPVLREFTARVTGAGAASEPWSIVRTQPFGEKMPIIALNDTMMYNTLARRIGVDRPFTGIQFFDLSAAAPLASASIGQEPADPKCPKSLESIASLYADVVRRAHSRGPCILLGFCAEGALALEMARQLGGKTALVVMIDSWAPGHFARLGRVKGRLAKVSYYWHRLLWHLRKLPYTSFDKQLWHLALMGPRLAKFVSLISEEVRREQESILAHIHNEIVESVRLYVPQVCKVPILLLRSGEHPRGRWLDESLGWDAFAAGGIEVATVPGHHREIFEDPNAGALAEAIRDKASRLSS